MLLLIPSRASGGRQASVSRAQDMGCSAGCGVKGHCGDRAAGGMERKSRPDPAGCRPAGRPTTAPHCPWPWRCSGSWSRRGQRPLSGQPRVRSCTRGHLSIWCCLLLPPLATLSMTTRRHVTVVLMVLRVIALCGGPYAVSRAWSTRRRSDSGSAYGAFAKLRRKRDVGFSRHRQLYATSLRAGIGDSTSRHRTGLHVAMAWRLQADLLSTVSSTIVRMTRVMTRLA